MSRMITAPIAAFGLALAMPAAAQDSDTEITHGAEPIATVVAFMNAFDAQDAEAMAQHVLDDGVVAFVEERAEEDRVGFVPLNRLAGAIAGNPADLEEPIWNIRAIEDGPVAVVTANFELLVDGNRSHCGVDIFTLMRVEGEWKIATVTYSHITEGCDAD